MTDEQVKLIAERLDHIHDLLKADLEALRAIQAHDRQMTNHRLSMIETEMMDMETRLRAATEGVTQFKVWSGLAAGGSGLVSLVALIRSFLCGNL